MIQLLYFIPHIIDTIAASMSHQPAIEGDPASGLLKKLSECAETAVIAGVSRAFLL